MVVKGKLIGRKGLLRFVSIITQKTLVDRVAAAGQVASRFWKGGKLPQPQQNHRAASLTGQSRHAQPNDYLSLTLRAPWPKIWLASESTTNLSQISALR